MTLPLLPYALTTVERVKTRLQIDNTNLDIFLCSLINAVSEKINNYTNRNFLYGENTELLPWDNNGPYLLLSQPHVKEITSIQWRSGFPNNPNWIDFIPSSYELLGNGESGMVRVYGGMFSGDNIVKITYKYGYKIDFTKYGDITNHELPADITDVCERMVIRLYKKRSSEGIKDETFNQEKLTWNEQLDADIKDDLNGYVRTPRFF